MTHPDWRRLPSLSALRAFEAAARLGGFSAAARALNVTHAAVAQAVRGLEAELGLPLLRREGRGVLLTPEGRRLARSLQEGFGLIAEGVEALRLAEGRRGLRVTATPAFAQSVLMPRLADFWRRHPEVAVSISPSLAVVDLVAEGFDVALRAGSGTWEGVEAEPILAARYMVAATPDLAARAARAGGDLSGLPWAVDSSSPQDRGFLLGGGLDPDRLAVMHLASPTLIVSAALAGYGLVFASNVVLGEALAAGRLVEVPFPNLPAFTYWAVTPAGPRRPALAAFVEWICGPFAADVSRETAA